MKNVENNSKSKTGQTLLTYRFHLAKLKWYCKSIKKINPSQWTIDDANDFEAFLRQVPIDALCPLRISSEDHRYTPFRVQPSASAQHDILRFVKSMFVALHSIGYIPTNPMIFSRTQSCSDTKRDLPIDTSLYDLVLSGMDVGTNSTRRSNRKYFRDRFIFVALRQLGLRPTELVKSTMAAFVENRNHSQWYFIVKEDAAMGGLPRRIPVHPSLIEALANYRKAFGFTPLPSENENDPLIMSLRFHYQLSTIIKKGSSSEVCRHRLRDYVTTRQCLYKIVKARLNEAAISLEKTRRVSEAAVLRKASPRWLRHVFAINSVYSGKSLRTLRDELGHASSDLTHSMYFSTDKTKHGS